MYIHFIFALIVKSVQPLMLFVSKNNHNIQLTSPFLLSTIFFRPGVAPPMEPYQLKAQWWGITDLDVEMCVLSGFFQICIC